MKRRTREHRYIEKLRISRGIRPVGEVFGMSFRGVGWLYGRVIRNDCALEAIDRRRPWPRRPGLYLVYIYKAISSAALPVPTLGRTQLLFPPCIIDGAGWTHGYFLSLEQRPLKRSDVRTVHCFEDDTRMKNGKVHYQYVDEYGNLLKRKSSLCEWHGMGSFGTIEHMVAQALGLPNSQK